jgi:hypothetical protein
METLYNKLERFSVPMEPIPNENFCFNEQIWNFDIADRLKAIKISLWFSLLCFYLLKATFFKLIFVLHKDVQFYCHKTNAF